MHLRGPYFGPMDAKTEFWHLWVDTGGTFTDCIAVSPAGEWQRIKVLSSSCLRGTLEAQLSPRVWRFRHRWPVRSDIFGGYRLRLPGQREEVVVRRIDFAERLLETEEPLHASAPTPFELTAGEEAPLLAARLATRTPLGQPFPPLRMRLGTTRGTNALLEGKGARVVFCTTAGLSGLVRIGTQQRPDLFQLDVPEPTLLYTHLVEVPEVVAADGRVVAPLTAAAREEVVRQVAALSPEAVAVALRNSYRNDAHERALAEALQEAGIAHVSVSSALSPSVQLLPRAQTALVNAYLTPVMETYLDHIAQATRQAGRDSTLHVMTSSGGLVRAECYQPKDSLLSGPAGGVAGAAYIGRLLGFERLLTLDMGGTSTDTARYDGAFDYRWQTEVGGVCLQTPSLAIETVAAGGGSICGFDGQKLFVGPESAGAEPGPACYGAGGPLALTDVNLLLGKLDPGAMGIPVSRAAAERALEALCRTIEAHRGEAVEAEALLRGFEQIANEKMADAIRRISVARGFDPADYALLAFGGAGGLHACKVAELLEIDTVILPADAGLLSAFGIGTAAISRMATRQVLAPLRAPNLEVLFAEAEEEARAAVASEGVAPHSIHISRRLCYLRFEGQEHTVEIEWSSGMALEAAFERRYRQLFGHYPTAGTVEVESIKVVAAAETELPALAEAAMPDTPGAPMRQVQACGRQVPVYYWPTLALNQHIEGPAIVLHDTATAWLDEGWQLEVACGHNLVLRHRGKRRLSANDARSEVVALELFANRFTAIAEEMGAQLQRTAFSTNVKERLDFSCALLDPEARLLVNAPHIPVHLGSLGLCARLVLEKLPLEPGDVIITNHPKYGGSHLPDITLLAGVWDEGHLLGYVINRAHHADIGGKRPGSMPPDARTLAEEGVVIAPTYLMHRGEMRWDQLEATLTAGPWPVRMLRENLADIKAALAALRTGQARLVALARAEGHARTIRYMRALRQATAAAFLDSWKRFDGCIFEAKEYLDDGSPICVRIQVQLPRISFDFTGTAPVHPGNLNANRAILHSVVIYVLRLVCGKAVPLNEGLMEHVHIVLPHGTLLHPPFEDEGAACPAVVGGNTEVSQRLADTLLKALDVAACSQGTMNNLLFGNDRFGYYETIGGGVGAGPGFHGRSGVHQHMTNTRLTDVEELERRYPVRVHRFALRHGSGGAGRWRGGDGIVREIEFLAPVTLTLLSQHRTEAPYGKCGGRAGAPGAQWVVRADGRREPLQGIDSRAMAAGDRIRIETPGGGGWGTPPPSC